MVFWWILAVAGAMCLPGPPLVLVHGEDPHDGQEPVVLTAAYDQRATFEALSTGQVELVRTSDDRRVGLALKSTHPGANQLLWLPQEALADGRWMLHRDGEPVWSDGRGLIWVVGGDPLPADRPRWRAAPTLGVPDIEAMGCGPSVDLVVTLSADHVVWVEATLTPAGRDPISRLYAVNPGQKTLQLGRSMCGGGLDLVPDRDHTLVLTAIGSRGQRVPAPGGPLSFHAP